MFTGKRQLTDQGMLACGCPSKYPSWNHEDVDIGAWLVHEQKAPMFLHMPIGYEAWLDRQHKDIKRLELNEKWPGFCLTRSALFRGKILCPLQEEHSLARNTYRLSNPYYLRVQVFNGDIGGIKDTVRSMQSSLLDEAKLPKELYLSYLTCPQCQGERGGNKIMLLRHWVESPKLKERLKKQKKT